MSEIEDITDTEFNELLEQVHLHGRTQDDIVNLRTNEWQDMSEEMLGVSTPEDDTLSTSGMIPCDGRCWELHSWMDSCQDLYLFSY